MSAEGLDPLTENTTGRQTLRPGANRIPGVTANVSCTGLLRLTEGSRTSSVKRRRRARIEDGHRHAAIRREYSAASATHLKPVPGSTKATASIHGRQAMRAVRPRAVMRTTAYPVRSARRTNMRSWTSLRLTIGVSSRARGIEAKPGRSAWRADPLRGNDQREPSTSARTHSTSISLAPARRRHARKPIGPGKRSAQPSGWTRAKAGRGPHSVSKLPNVKTCIRFASPRTPLPACGQARRARSGLVRAVRHSSRPAIQVHFPKKLTIRIPRTSNRSRPRDRHTGNHRQLAPVKPHLKTIFDPHDDTSDIPEKAHLCIHE